MRISDWSSDVCSSDLCDGPHTIGKSTEAMHLALTEKAKGNPVLFLSYTDLDTFEAFGECFEDSTVPPNKLNDNRQAAVQHALRMFRNEGYVRSGIFSWWNNLFPSGTYPYAGDSPPLLLRDDFTLASPVDQLHL